MKILLACDASQSSKNAIKWALANFPAGDFLLLHCMATPFLVSGCHVAPASFAMAHLIEAQEQNAKATMARLMELFGDHKERLVGHYVVRGDPRYSIVEYASTHKVELVVVGTRDLGNLSMLLGSVSDHCLHNAPCNVAVVKTSADRVTESHSRKVLMPTDGSMAFAGSLEFAKRLLKAGDEVVLLHAYEAPIKASAHMFGSVGGAAPGAATLNIDMAADQKYQAHVATCLAEHATAIESITHTKPVVKIVHGDARQVIDQLSEDGGIDIILMGSRGRGEVRSVLLGSVSRHTAHHAKSSVIITRPTHAAPPV